MIRVWQTHCGYIVKLNLGLHSYISIDMYDLILMNDLIFSARFWFSYIFLHLFYRQIFATFYCPASESELLYNHYSTLNFNFNFKCSKELKRLKLKPTVFCCEWDNSPSRQLILWGQILHWVLTCPWGPQDRPLLGAPGHHLHPWQQKSRCSLTLSVLPNTMFSCRCEDLPSLPWHPCHPWSREIHLLPEMEVYKKIMLIGKYIFVDPASLEDTAKTTVGSCSSSSTSRTVWVWQGVIGFRIKP